VERVVREQGNSSRASFVAASADSLHGVDDAGIDVVTTRSVLIYVKEKCAAFDAFFRVLRPGGRISLAEPINGDYLALNACADEYYGYRVPAVADVLARLRRDDEDGADRDDHPMTGFNHVDLVRHSEAAGFRESHLELRIDVAARDPRAWDSFVNFAPNPNAPTIGETFRETLSADEVRRLESSLRPLVEQSLGRERTSMAYLWAIKE